MSYGSVMTTRQGVKIFVGRLGLPDGKLKPHRICDVSYKVLYRQIHTKISYPDIRYVSVLCTSDSDIQNTLLEHYPTT